MKHGFTLIELIVVIIIVGVLAAVGISQYSAVVEKGRLAEARTRIGAISKLAYEYYLNNGTFIGITDADVGIESGCHPTDYYQYNTNYPSTSYIYLYATRCGSGGKSPLGSVYGLCWGLFSNGVLFQHAYYNSSTPGAWVYTSNWGGCCR